MKPEDLSPLRHSCAHLLAAAVLDIFPGTKQTIGPAIEHGFYYDFDFPEPISDKDLARIEQKMREFIKSWESFEKIEVSKEEAIKQFKDNSYKQELINEFSSKGEKLTLYKSGNYVDLCRGGHTDNPKKDIKYFKLLSIAGAYWRGDEKNKMLTRIYGTAFSTKEDIEKYLWQIEEAKKRDNRKLGRELDLFVMSDEVGSGFPLFTPKGTTFRRLIDDYLVKTKKENGFQFVWTPHVTKSNLYHISKHWGKYDAMFKPMEIDKDEYVLKPMNCPHHFMIYGRHPHSYKELPLRYAENATVYRNEKSGELNGLLRVRASTTDDTHAFVTHNQIPEELTKIISLIKTILKNFGFTKYRARISTRDPNDPNKYIGKPEVWDKAEKALIDAAKNEKLEHYIGPGEAAFYGPKIDFMIEDAIGREWQCSTVQLDFSQPENFNLTYINAEGKEERPAVIHIAMIGSIERYMGVLIEHYAGAFPFWLAPVQTAVITISDKQNELGKAVTKLLLNTGIRAELNEEQKTVGYKIRQSTLQKIPYMIIIGDKEVESTKSLDDSQKINVSVRTRDGKDLGQLTLYELINKLKAHIEKYE